MFRFFIAALLVATASNLFAGEAGIPKAVWKASRLIGSPDPPLPLRVERVFPELKLDEPVALRELPTGGRFIVLQRKGQILTFSSAGGATEADVAFDLEEDCKQRANEKIGAARDIELDPDFLANGFIYVVWSIAPWDVEAGTRVSRFTLGNQSPPKIDPQSRLDLLTYPSGDHIGASLRFGRDGYLYAANGDGSPPFPPDQHAAAQDLRDLRGSVLRIDVRHASSEKPYQVPADNPFLDVVGAKPEIYAFGIRNGFRSAFNPLDDSLWVADVGWERCELIHRIEKGGNHGWSLFEGPYPVKPNQPTAPGVCVTLAPRISPAIVMERSEAQSITGGVFLPHNATLVDHDPALENQYIYGCYMNGMVWTADVADLKNIRVTKCADSGLRLLDFVMVSLDDTPKGKKDLLAVDHAGGLYRFRPNDEQTLSAFPTKLSETGLFTNVKELRPETGVYGWQPTTEMYRDGATTARHFANPGEGRISHHQYGKFQTGMVLSNTISRRILEAGQERNRKIETQLLVFDGLNWDAFTYRWNDDESDANLVAGEGDRRELTVADERLGTKHLTHRFVSRSQCKTCHHVFNQGPITLRPMYLWADDDGGEGNGVYHSWKKLVADGHVEEAGCDPEDRMVAVDESLSSLSDRARSYLEINCRSCHQPAGGATSAIHLARGLSNQQLQVIDQPATQGDFGLLGGKIVVPGHPEQSILMYRLATSGPGSMPKNNHCDPDLAGGRLLWDWITSLESGDEASVAPSPLSDALLDWHRAATRPASDARVLASKRLANSADAVVRGLFEPWLPQNERIVRVGNEPNTVELLAIEGNAERGRIWYTQHAAAQCRNCHHVDKADALIGPSLQGISRKRTRAELLEQILMPSKQIEPQWRSWQVQLASGQVVTGLKISDDAQHWTLKQADGKTTTIAADEIEFSQASAQSLMPDGLLATLTPQEAADLISFLISL